MLFLCIFFFSESRLNSISIHWNVESFVNVLMDVFGFDVEISSDNFIPLNEAALFFGVDSLLCKCRVWLEEVTSFKGIQSPQLCLDGLVHIWKYGLELANDYILQLCTSYLAMNFMWALSFNSYTDVPDKLLYSCIQHPDLTVDRLEDFPILLFIKRTHCDAPFNCFHSEKHLCEAILVFLNANTTKSEGLSSSDLCDKVRAWDLSSKHNIKRLSDNLDPTISVSFWNMLVSVVYYQSFYVYQKPFDPKNTERLVNMTCPLYIIIFTVSGKRRCGFFSKFADKATSTILSLARYPSTNSTDLFGGGDSSQHRIRLTKYTQKIDVSSCPQITAGVFLLSVLPSCETDSMLRKIIKKASMNNGNIGESSFQISDAVYQNLSFEAVQELDISNCPSLSLESAIDCFCKLFPSLRTLRAAYYLNFKIRKLRQLVQKLPLLANIDLSLDIKPVIPAQVSIAVSSSVLIPESSTASLFYTSKPLVSNIIRLTLEGRTDLRDSDLCIISEVCRSLSYVNIKGCTSVTDHGISKMILICKRLKSILACDTSFGNGSVVAFSSGISTETEQSENNSQLMVFKLLTLHVGGCHGITGKILSELMSRADSLKSLCVRDLKLVDDALYRFSGVSLEMLDVSNTEVSFAALSRIIRRNPDLKSLKTRGCIHLLRQESETKERKLFNPLYTPEEIYYELGKSCKLEEIELGWGFSFFSLEALKPAMRTLRTLLVGLGGSLGPDGLKLLPAICPLLETLILFFQVISDSAITDIINTLPHLQSLALCYCLGDISPLSFKFRMPNLRNLKLERVTPWMTNGELATLAENCENLVKLSLIGCTLLDSEAQAIISSGWPGLTSLHLEECGKITANGVRSLLDCHALEDLVLRHTGPGIPRNFITYATSKLPMLRKISLDICDSREADFDVPTLLDRCFLSIVKIARCKLRKNTLDFHHVEAHRTPVHKETLVMVWNSNKLVTTVVKERV
ncbi:PREDICTED: BTB/POZ domain-containing protein FBL11 [Erythranthe guttata]|uniref:BTB/POZ domain-containing protein FBL11 n=1 Tax=Erythranthe guttata TaxID=4155 RepID=UPI00064D733D|nr:PREDICTED: BTB/POZ domain-containing protein FBL11 [Erythranthe guttata]|eukprot:XP_012835815.1 PREDICTED: BTB/POZ domain-containing protein FBL11 [Erythranthe guttata]